MSEGTASGLNRETLGKSYQGKPIVVDAESVKSYAQATSDDNPFYLDDARPGGIVAPPMYSVRLTKEVLFQPLLDRELRCDLLMLLHGEQEMRFYDLIRPGDRIETRSEIAEIVDKDSGQVLNLKITCSRDGRVVTDAVTTLFIRSRQRRDKGGEKKAAPPEPLPTFTLHDEVQVRPDQSRLYARASLDDNPIHVDDNVARAAGLKGVILQGLCTMAFCQRAIVNRAADGDPRRLRRLKVRFTKPVYPGSRITVEGYVIEEQADRRVLGFRAVSDQGTEVISGGVGEVAR
jgi:(3R)-3-hydroxyacyl-CoA dehydrogenase / 3a,7a,12a-trihydroxy-5b-cholest-24-enoyl-CoA hydratase / enoyl-CoA hydratase 2